MEQTEVSDGVFAYDVHWPDAGEAITIGVVEGERTILIGTGASETVDDVLAIARDHGVDVALVEHGDVDHYEGIPALRDAIGVEVAVPAADVDSLKAVGISVDHPLDAGETYWGIDVVGAPGHTRGNAAYLVDDVLFAGDTAVGADSVFAAPGEWSGPLAVIEPDYNWDDGLARESVSNLLDRGYEAVVVAHGADVLSDGREAVETLAEDLGV